jgi:hypothetical protein
MQFIPVHSAKKGLWGIGLQERSGGEKVSSKLDLIAVFCVGASPRSECKPMRDIIDSRGLPVRMSLAGGSKSGLAFLKISCSSQVVPSNVSFDHLIVNWSTSLSCTYSTRFWMRKRRVTVEKCSEKVGDSAVW